MSVLLLHLFFWFVCLSLRQIKGQCEVGGGQVYDVLPPERICVLQIEDRRLHLNWTEAKSCSQSPFVEPIDYNVTYGNTAEMRTTQTSMLEFTTADMLSNNAEYIFQVTAITSNGKTSPCVSVSIAISPNSSPMQQCTVAMYECVNQNPSTTSDGSIVTTLMPHIPTFEPGMVTSSLQTDATQGTPSESQDTTWDRLIIIIPVVVLGSVLLILLVAGLVCFAFLARRNRKKRTFTINPIKTASSVAAYNPIAVSQESRRYAITYEDKFESSTIRRMSMRSSVFENRARMKLTRPQITSVCNEMHATLGQQVTLRLSFIGTPQPTVAWTFKGRPLGEDPSVELSADGSLVIVCVEPQHAGRYGIEISNTIGRTKGHINLIVHQSPDETHVAREESVLESACVKTNAVKKEEFGEYVARMHALNNKGFINQFQAIESCEEGKFFLVGRTGSNQQLNRFRNITAYDHNRIVLKSIPGYSGNQNEYINASYIDGLKGAKKYIASQGPLPETVADFWHMVWQERISTIAMMTNTIERGKKKCEVYWPDVLFEEKEVGPFIIKLTAQQVFADYTVRYMKLEILGEDKHSWKVVQYHYTSWPDHGVPEYAGPILLFLKHIKTKHTQEKTPLLVHCSAGVGRTGTLIGIDIILAQALTEGIIDAPAVVTKMREQRMKMVQTTDQYMLIHDAVLEFLICGNTRIIASSFNAAMDHLSKCNKQTGKSGYETQFEVLEQVSPKPDEVMCTVALQNQRKNRNDGYLPPDIWRVFLLREVPDYINASFINGYRVQKGFIIAQSPMLDTIREFWHMIFDRKCNVVVMLADIQEEGAEVCAQYWPRQVNSSQHFKEITVTTESEKIKKGYTERVISVLETKSGNKHKVTQYQIGHWTADGLNSQPRTITEVINDIIVVQRRTGNRPVVVHGCNTVSRSCIFCALVNAIEFCKMESVIDIFEVVKAIRIQKPGAIQTVEQYKFIYDLILYFLDEYSDYSNFK